MDNIFHQMFILPILSSLVCFATVQGVFNCSGIRQDERVACPVQNNGTLCHAVGCCWNASEIVSPLKCFTKRGGTCMQYRGTVCAHSLNSTLAAYKNATRFFFNKFGLLFTERFLQLVMNVINNDVFVNDARCRHILSDMLCHYTLPPCYQDNTIVDFCREDCLAIFKDCRASLNQVIGAIKFFAGDKYIDFVHTAFPNCSKHQPSSYYKDLPGNKTCIHTGFFDFIPPLSPTKNSVIPSHLRGVLNCSGIPQDEKVACAVQNNGSFCHAVGCCWNASEIVSPLKCFTKRGGTCMQYRGTVCAASLNSTLAAYKNTRRFFDNKFGLFFTESFLQIVMDVIHDDDYVNNERCRRILSDMLCHYTLQPCYQDNTIVDFCREDCLAIFKECSASLNQVIGAVKFLAEHKNIDFVHTAFPNCSRHQPSSYYKELPGNKTCIRTGFFSLKAEGNPPEDDDNLEIILPVVLIALLIIVVGVVIFVIYRRNKKENAKGLPHKGSITMRDRLRAESLKSLDSRLLRLYDPDKMKQYRLDHVTYVKDLGEGFFGKVFQGRAVGLVDQQPKKEIHVAVKALKTDPSKEQKDEFFREVTLMSILQHPNIVQLLAVSTEEEPYGMVFEYMSGGDLNQYLRNAKPAETSLDSNDKAKVYLSQEDLVSIATQIASGMQFLAELKFVHRDLAARNVLMADNLVAKIGDFGMSRDLYSSDYYKMSKETMLPIRWLAPEAFLYGKFSLKSDVYAYGVVLWEIFTFGLQPYYGYTNKEVTEFIKKEIHLGKPDNCPDLIYSVMKECWHRDPEKRIEFPVIGARLNDPYNNYDVPPSSDNEDGNDVVDSTEQDMGNYDVPRSPATSDYDIPRSTALEAEYDVPRSPDDTRMSYADHEDEGAESRNALLA